MYEGTKKEVTKRKYLCRHVGPYTVMVVVDVGGAVEHLQKGQLVGKTRYGME